MKIKSEKQRKEDPEDGNLKGVQSSSEKWIFWVPKSSFFIFICMHMVFEDRCEFCGKTFRKSFKLKSIYKFSMSLGEIW